MAPEAGTISYKIRQKMEEAVEKGHSGTESLPSYTLYQKRGRNFDKYFKHNQICQFLLCCSFSGCMKLPRETAFSSCSDLSQQFVNVCGKSNSHCKFTIEMYEFIEHKPFSPISCFFLFQQRERNINWHLADHSISLTHAEPLGVTFRPNAVQVAQLHSSQQQELNGHGPFLAKRSKIRCKMGTSISFLSWM